MSQVADDTSTPSDGENGPGTSGVEAEAQSVEAA